MRVAINGMGRIGRLLFRRLLDQEGIELVAVNDVMPVDNLVYLLKYDSLYGPLHKTIRREDGWITVEAKRFVHSRKKIPFALTGMVWGLIWYWNVREGLAAGPVQRNT